MPAEDVGLFFPGGPVSILGPVVEDPVPTSEGVPDYRGMFNTLLARSFDGIALTDRASRRYIEVSDSFCQMTGYRRAEIVGRTSVEVGLVTEQERGDAAVERADRGMPGLYRRRLRRKGGALLVAEFSHTLLPDEALVLTVLRDVTEAERQSAQMAFQAAITETMAEGVAVIRAGDGVIVFTNATFDQLFGYQPGELAGQPIQVINAPTEKTPEETAAEITAVLRQEGVWRGEVKNRKKDGTPLWCSVNVATIEHPDFGTVWISVHSDITARKQAEEQFRHLVEGSPDAQLVVDHQARIVLANSRAEELFGYDTGELVGRPVEQLVPEARREDHVAHRIRYLAEPRTRAMGPGLDLQGRRRDGTWFPVEVSLSPLVTDQQLMVSSTVRDITDRLADEEARARLGAIVASSGDAVVGVMPDGRIDIWNLGAELLYGYREEEVIGQRVKMLIPPELAEGRPQLVSQVLEGGAIEHFETEDVRRDGSRVAVAVTVSPIRNRAGAIIGAARIARDITDRKRFEHELQFFADHDPLTGLFNRRRFAEELTRQAAYVARFRAPASLAVADLDNFKYINDTLGHKAGDQMICGVSRILRNRLRSTDILARLGGDEFAVLLPGTDLAQAENVAEELRRAVHDFKTVLNRQTVRCTVSVGIAALGGASGEDTLAAADLAMYAAKRQGRDRVALAGEDSHDFQTHLSWSERLHDALEHGRFELYAQPIVEISTGAVRQHELLLRLRDEHGDLLAPAEFIYTAERLGIIREIDRWVAGEAIRLLGADTNPDNSYAVNVSGASMADEGLFHAIEKALDGGVDPARLTFEITETAAIADFDLARDFVGHLERLGCTTALDDFGAGFGSFSYLKRLPVDYIKIDGDFVSALPGSTSDQALVKAIVDVAHGLGKQTVAEHVASPQALTLLDSYGVEYAQGFYLGKPVPARSLDRR